MASLTIWTWLLAQPAEKPWVDEFNWILGVCAAIGIIRCADLLLSIRKIAECIRQIELRWGNGLAFTWKNFMLPRHWYLSMTTVLIWSSLVIGNLVIARSLDSTWLRAAKS